MRDEAKAVRQRLLDEARKEADGLRARQRTPCEMTKRSRSEEITRRNKEEVFAITQKMLAHLATTTLEERLGEVLTRRLQR